jgi:hypothetical protein
MLAVAEVRKNSIFQKSKTCEHNADALFGYPTVRQSEISNVTK